MNTIIRGRNNVPSGDDFAWWSCHYEYINKKTRDSFTLSDLQCKYEKGFNEKELWDIINRDYLTEEVYIMNVNHPLYKAQMQNNSEVTEGDTTVEEIHYKGGVLDMKMGGDGARIFMTALIEFFEQNGGKNFLTTTLEGNGKRYSVDITNLDGNDSSAKRLNEMNNKLNRIWREINNAHYFGDMKVRNFYNTIHEIAEIIQPGYEEIGKKFIE